ncbi:VRR-NUC domain-containing protein [Hymenobacter cavernae]|uniref:VRR-NUC domain-containing protein n=1 Tax=Hymenobacter cavernae TaxID=2044852 RepID=A0ABQ1UM75_9BACT|nr:VRR-NUC domain-containing protein [Hymenobacter cavernae]GGF22426.1 hypothetical protein GCM10011383_37570 [Hymenobacter cavernae]
MSFLPETEKQRESRLQSTCHTWFHNELCSLPEFQHLRGLGFMIHNDGAKSALTAALDTSRGLIPGIPDWFLSVPCSSPFGTSYHGFYFEFKVGKNKLSPIQSKRIEQLRAMGYKVAVVDNFEHYKELIMDYLNSPKLPESNPLRLGA